MQKIKTLSDLMKEIESWQLLKENKSTGHNCDTCKHYFFNGRINVCTRKDIAKEDCWETIKDCDNCGEPQPCIRLSSMYPGIRCHNRDQWKPKKTVNNAHIQGSNTARFVSVSTWAKSNKPKLDINVIREWRKQQFNAGKPSSLKDYYKAHGL